LWLVSAVIGIIWKTMLLCFVESIDLEGSSESSAESSSATSSWPASVEEEF